MEVMKSLKPATWLDVGAGDGSVSRALRENLGGGQFECIDIKAAPGVRVFDGHTLPEGRWDAVLFNFVLHHAAHETRPLVKAAVASSRWVVLQEDVPDGTAECWERLRNHDIRGIFRTPEQWKALFREYDSAQRLCVTLAENLQDTNGYHVPRRLMVFDGKAFS